MKLNIKNLGLAAAIAMLGVTTSCNDSLDLKPITQITPEEYYKNADQLANYVNNYYNAQLINPLSYYSRMYHQADYSDGLNRSDINTDIACIGGGSTSLFADNHWQTPTNKALQGFYGNIRVWNYFFSMVLPRHEAGQISGDATMIKNYIGEAYFFRALAYYQLLVQYGDAPIIEEVLQDVNAELVAHSERAPRNEVARFILSDLDKAISMLCDRGTFNGQRINRQAAALFKSRVALFEGTFEKYHRGSGRVPGDAEWPGAKMDYNAGKTFNIDSEISFFLTEAMNAAKEAVGNVSLTLNNKVLHPEVGDITGWNPYFEMYSQLSLAGVDEVLFWKEYNQGLGVKHNAPYRTELGCNDGLTRQFVEGFLMTDGKPIYASDKYKGDKSIDDVKADRDYRLQLFVWGESDLHRSDAKFGADNLGALRGVPAVNDPLAETRAITGYQSKKYFTYDYAQTWHDQILGVNACPIFRVAEAMLNYIEACVEKNGSVDGTADLYWRALRDRAGVDADYMATVAATDLSKESQLSKYSGNSTVSSLIFNVRRERGAELFNEGLRMADLVRWRSFDPLLTTKWIPEGVNFWDEMYKDEAFEDIVCDGSSNAMVSGPEQGKYLRPYSASLMKTNELKEGYNWHEAYYLYPIGLVDMTSSAEDRNVANAKIYQNPNWPTTGGEYCIR